MGKPDPPAPPDYRGAAQEQAQASAEITNMQTYANRPNQVNPWGDVSWGTEAVRDPATGQMVTQWTQNQNLTPDAQAALDSQQRLMMQRSGLAGGMYGQMEDEFGQPIDFASARALQDAPDAQQYDSSSRYYDEAGDAIYGQFERRNEPRFEQESAAMDTQLRNQGLSPGDEAYDYQMQQMQQGQEDARLGAQYQATIGSGAEAQRMLGMDVQAGGAGFQQGMQQAGFQNTVRQQQISEEMQRRGFTLNEINAILTGQQVQQPNMASFSEATKSETPQYLSAANMGFQADMDVSNFEQAQAQSQMDALTGMAGGAMMMSDVRLKKNIEQVGESKSGLRIYTWEWNALAKSLGITSLPTTGVMAQEVATVAPGAVHISESGYLYVDYELLSAYEKETCSG